jgi:hypothetical protein
MSAAAEECEHGKAKDHEIPLYESGVKPVFVFMLNVRVLAAEGSECYVLQEY